MSKDSDKSEPSMDDILASIRRIIDEDGSKTRKPAAAPGGKAATDILDLTEMVNDDGSVTSLQRPGATAPAASRLIDDDEPPIYAEQDDRDRPTANISAGPRPMLAGDPRAPNAPQPVIERAPQPIPPAPPRQQPASPPPAAPQAAPQQAQPMPPQPPRITPAPAMGGPISLTPVNPPAQGQPGLVSGQASNAAAAAFDRLAQAALQQQQPPAAPAAPKAPSPTVGGRALEDLVGEMLRPMLKQWLDANLPAIVERLVQQEIQKMSKR